MQGMHAGVHLLKDAFRSYLQLVCLREKPPLHLSGLLFCPRMLSVECSETPEEILRVASTEELPLSEFHDPVDPQTPSKADG